MSMEYDAAEYARFGANIDRARASEDAMRLTAERDAALADVRALGFAADVVIEGFRRWIVDREPTGTFWIPIHGDDWSALLAALGRPGVVAALADRASGATPGGRGALTGASGAGIGIAGGSEG